jgi:DNA-binding transcriptional MocR family regulator
MIFYTDEESRTLRTAVYGAMVLVSDAQPGSVVQERFAGIKAMVNLSRELRDVLGSARVSLPAGTPDEVENAVLEALRRSMKILSAKAPEDADGFPAAVLAICREVAAADGDVADAEDVVVTKVQAALAR